MVKLLALVIAVACLWFAISWLRGQPASVLRPLFTKVALVIALSMLLLAVFSGRLHPFLGIACGVALLVQRLLALRQFLAQNKATQQPSGGASSEVSTRFLEVTLDHDSGEMDGTVREGRFAGRLLSKMSLDDLLDLLVQCHADDAQSAAVLESYLDHVYGDQADGGGWRERAASDGAADGRRGAQAKGGPMNVVEARDVLGVGEAASDDEITAAHRKLMQQHHPDRGGSTYFAAKLNQAKDLLLKQR